MTTPENGEQAYYWQHTWQEGEKETLDALAAGEGKVFANADEAIRWLLSAPLEGDPVQQD